MSVTVLQKHFVYKKQAVSQVWAVGHTYLTSGLKYILSQPCIIRVDGARSNFETTYLTSIVSPFTGIMCPLVKEPSIVT